MALGTGDRRENRKRESIIRPIQVDAGIRLILFMFKTARATPCKSYIEVEIHGNACGPNLHKGSQGSTMAAIYRQDASVSGYKSSLPCHHSMQCPVSRCIITLITSAETCMPKKPIGALEKWLGKECAMRGSRTNSTFPRRR